MSDNNNSTSSSSDDSTKVATGEWGAFLTSVITNLIILTAILLAFFILRALRKNRYLYQPQYYDSIDNGTQRIPELPVSPFGFITTVIRFPTAGVLQMRGVDSYMFLQVIKMFIIMFLGFLPIGIALLIALDKTGGGRNNGIPEIGMANLREKSRRLYAHAVVLDVFTVIALYLLYRLYEKYTTYRTQWLRNDEAHNYTVMFQGLSQQDLNHAPAPQYFSTLFPRNNITGAHYVAEDDFMFEVIKERELQQRELNRANAVFAHTGVRPKHKTKLLFGKKVDSIEHYERVIETCNTMLAEHRALFARDPHYARVGFATFGSIAEASNVLKSGEAATYKAQPAPQETDIFWKRVNRAASVTLVKRFITTLVILALVFLWAIPIVFIQGIANLENLSKISAFSFLSGVNNWSAIPKGLIQQYLPPLFVIVFLALVPKIIAAIMKSRGVYTESELSREVMKKYFIFQLFNVFLVSMWAGGIFAVAQQIKDESGWAVVSAIGAGVAAGSLFFINYVLIYVLFKIPFNLLRIGDLIKGIIKRRNAPNEQYLREVQRPEDFRFDTGYVVLILLFLIGFSYSTLNAFIIPFMIVFFSIFYFCAKYMIVWVYYPKWDSGGLHWPVAFNRIIASMILSQVILIIVLILRRSASAAVLAPAPIVTFIFALWVHRRFNASSTILHENSYPSLANGMAFARNYEDPVTRQNNMGPVGGMNQGFANGNIIPSASVMPSATTATRRSSLRKSATDIAKSPALRSSPRLRNSPALRKSGGSVYSELGEDR